jgi:hypothetical protein
MKFSIKQLRKQNLRYNLSLNFLENQTLNNKQLEFISSLIYGLIENKFWNSINNYLETESPKQTPIHRNFYHKVNVLPQFMNKSKNNIFVEL